MVNAASLPDFNWLTMSFELVGGLALFLYGMLQMTNALKLTAGKGLTFFLGRMTKNRWSALTAGAGITAIIQSSSVTTVLVVGFVSAGLISFPKTLGIILGANIGTTITAQIIAFKVTELALVIVAVGYLLTVVFKSSRMRGYGNVFIGLGLVFLGMNFMTHATMPLREYPPFIEIMGSLMKPGYGILLGALFTALVQSSSATTGVVIVLASQNLLDVNTSIAVIIGANIGTCVTAILAAIGKPRAAFQVAFAHIFFKIAGATLWLFFIPELSKLVAKISGSDIARQVANAHTIFNVANALLFVGLTTPIARFVQFILPDKSKQTEDYLLDKYYLEHIPLALDMVDKVLSQMANQVNEIASNSINEIIAGDENKLAELRHKDAYIDASHEKVLSYIGQIQQATLSVEEMKRVRNQTDIANILETMGDIFTSEMVEAAEHRTGKGFSSSTKTREQLVGLYRHIGSVINTAVDAYRDNDGEKARKVLQDKAEFKQKHSKVHDHVYLRIAESEKDRVAIIRFEIELLEFARRIHGLARRLARRADDAAKFHSIQ